MVTLATDPGKRALLALVTVFCDRTGVSDKARAQWVDDVESTPAGMRADLYAHLREQLPPAPPAPGTADRCAAGQHLHDKAAMAAMNGTNT